ncbi:putative SUMO transferase [Trypoxylus dichotomus]
MGEVQNDRRAKIFQTCLGNLNECVELVGEYFMDDEKHSQLRIIEQLAKQYHEDRTKLDLSKAALKLTNDYFNSENNNQAINIDEVYNNSAKKCVNCIVPFAEHPDMKVIIDSLNNVSSVPGTSEKMNDECLVLTQSIQLLVDPITKTELQNPWKNKVCGHVYEYSTIMDYINSKKGKGLKCPYVGCANANIRKADLVEDRNLLIKIQNQRNTTVLQNSIQEID